jgi:hypothetical protein
VTQPFCITLESSNSFHNRSHDDDVCCLCSRLINQSCAALIHEGLETLTLAGVFIGVNADAEPTSAAIITGSPPMLPSLPATGHCAPLLSPSTNVPQGSYIAGTLSIVDAGFECTDCSKGNRVAVAGSRNVYMRRATVVGFGIIVSVHAPDNVSQILHELHSSPGSSLVGTSVRELSVALPTRPGTINGTAYIDGRPIHTMTPIVNITALSAAELVTHSFDQVCDRLGWGDNLLFPSHASAGALSVTEFGALGDGRSDDSHSIQRCVDAAAAAGVPVFVPRGVFRTTMSIKVPRGVQMVGLGRHLTMIISDDRTFRDSPLEDSRQNDRSSVVGDAPPILLYSDSPPVAAGKLASTSPGVETVVFGMSLIVPTYNVRANASMLVFRSSASTESGGFNVYRQMWTARLNVCGQYWGDTCRRRFFAQVPYNNAYTRIEGEETTLRMFVYFQEDSQNSVGLTSQSAYYRKLLIEGTRRPIDIVQLNGERCWLLGSRCVAGLFINNE